MQSYVAGKYLNRWAVLDTVSRVWYFIGCGKAFCERKARELNSIEQEG